MATDAIRPVDIECAPWIEAPRYAESSSDIGQMARNSPKALFQYILSVAVNGGIKWSGLSFSMARSIVANGAMNVAGNGKE